MESYRSSWARRRLYKSDDHTGHLRAPAGRDPARNWVADIGLASRTERVLVGVVRPTGRVMSAWGTVATARRASQEPAGKRAVGTVGVSGIVPFVRPCNTGSPWGVVM